MRIDGTHFATLTGARVLNAIASLPVAVPAQRTEVKARDSMAERQQELGNARLCVRASTLHLLSPAVSHMSLEPICLNPDYTCKPFPCI